MVLLTRRHEPTTCCREITDLDDRSFLYEAVAGHSLHLGLSGRVGRRLAENIRQFQFRDVRLKAASEIDDLADAGKLLGHTDKRITQTVYRRVWEVVAPTK